MVTTRYAHSSAAMYDSLYLLGGYAGNGICDIEICDNMAKGEWRKGFEIAHNLEFACAVKISLDEIITIAGNEESQRLVYKYNIATGEVRKLKDLAPTKVTIFSIKNIQPHSIELKFTMFFMHYFVYYPL